MPTTQTLRKYGLTLDEWSAILDRQGGVCPICGLVPSTNRFCVDHEHIKGWRKMPPEQRKLYVRGLVCWRDNNRVLTAGVTATMLRRAAEYLEEYEKRKQLAKVQYNLVKS
jgi:hypothetical protein